MLFRRLLQPAGYPPVVALIPLPKERKPDPVTLVHAALPAYCYRRRSYSDADTSSRAESFQNESSTPALGKAMTPPHAKPTLYRVRFSQSKPHQPTLHTRDCVNAQFFNPEPKQNIGFHLSGDGIRVLNHATAQEAYDSLDFAYPAAVTVCDCVGDKTLTSAVLVVT